MKKLLALVLALVMSMSLVTISNAAFKDGDKINADYKEAVDVMNAVGVLVGDENGNFNATENLTREQAAKIIAYLELGEKAADALVGGATFTDVAANRWSAGFVGYCAQAGVVNGVGNGAFDPAGQLTALQFGKMLLVELGYDAKAEKMVGTDWAINTSKLMATVKLMDKIDGSVNQVLTREKAAQMCLNAIEAPMVTYETKGSSISVNGAEINFGASVAKYETSTIAKDQNISRDKLTSGEYTVELGEKLYKDLKKVGSTDDFARPATKWTWKAEKVGTYVDKADKTYTAEVKSGDIYKDLNLSDKIESKNVKVYVNGKTVANNVALVKGGESALGQSANGVLTEVFYDDVADTAKIVQIHTYVGSIAKSVKATDKKDAYVVVTPEAARPNGVGGSGLEFETNEKFEDDAVVYYTYSEAVGQNGEIKSVAVCESIEGTVTETQNKIIDGKESKSVTIDGTTYKAAKQFAGEQIGSITVKNDYKVYLDKYGYMLKIEEVENLSANYALVLDLRGSSSFDSCRAKLLFGDGTEKVVDTEKDYTKSKNNVDKLDIVTYKVDNGVYTLKAVPAAKQHSAADLGAGEFVLINDKAGVEIKGNTLYTNSKTTFVVKDLNEDEINAYTGVKNAPTIKTEAAVNADVYAYTKSGSMTTIMFVLADNNTIIQDDNNKKLYVASKSVGNLVNDKDGSYFVYNAVVNGETKTVKVADDCAIDGTSTASSGKTLKGIYKSFTTNSKGIITSVTKGATLSTGETNEYMAETGIAKTSEDYTISAGLKNDKTYKNTITVDKDAKIYYVDKNGKIGDSSYNAIAVDDNDQVYAYVDDYMVKMLFIEEVARGVNDQDNQLHTFAAGEAGASVVNQTEAYTTFNFNIEAAPYAAGTLTLDYDVYVDGAKVTSKTINNISTTTTSVRERINLVTEASETVTAKVTDLTSTLTKVKYIDKDNSGADITTQMVKDGSTKTVSTAAAGAAPFTTKYKTTNGTATTTPTAKITNAIDVSTTVAPTADDLSYTSDAWSATHTNSVKANGNDFVVVEVTGLNGLYTTYSVTIENNVAATKVDRALSEYGVTGTNDKALALKVTVSSSLPTNVVSGYTYNLRSIEVQAGSASSAARFSEAYGYKVTIGELGSVILTETETKVALNGTLTVTKDIDITKADITVEVVDGMDVVDSTWNDHTVTLTFNYEVDNATGINTSNYTWDNGGKGNTATLATAVVSGKTVTLTFTGDPLLAGNTITVKNVAENNNAANNKIDDTTGIDVVLG